MQKLTDSLCPQDRKKRLVYLLISSIPLIGSYLFNTGFNLPFLGCPLLHYVGIPCPAWGLTRSFMAVARGDFDEAIAYHFFGPILFAAFLIGTVHFIVELTQRRKIGTFYTKAVKNPKFQIFCFLMLLSYHGVRLEGLWRSGELYKTITQSPLGLWLMNIS